MISRDDNPYRSDVVGEVSMSAYKAIVSILEDVADEPEVAAREILTALRALPTEAVGTGSSRLAARRKRDADKARRASAKALSVK